MSTETSAVPVLETLKRFIPGLGPAAQPAKKNRTRHKGNKSTSVVAATSGDDAVSSAAEPEEPQTASKGPGLKLAPESLGVVEPQAELPKRTPPSVIVSKRIKAIQKKVVSSDC